ncbi:MAG: ATP-dependent RecD-like DNA helicase [Clostridiales bacterium]|jgi:exodeoxyribonuclease V alpha subunit|nr:ATP-dependent RecD-like DNA helicase [Clostridiales bacterium]
MQEITGQINRIIFRNEENGWTVLELIDETGEEITAVGTLPLCAPGERVELCGVYVEHHSYGRQFKAQSCVSLAPASLEALTSYLSSGLIKGVGAATARAIVEHFGMDTLSVLENDPARLLEISGIGRARADTIKQSFFEQRAMRDVVMRLQGYGITVRQAMQLYQLYGAASAIRVEEDPYSLVQDVEGIGFKTADMIAMRVGVEQNARQRLRAGVTCMLLWARQEGHTYLPRDVLLRGAMDMLSADPVLVEEALDELIIDGSLHYTAVGDGDAVYLRALYRMEAGCAAKLLELNRQPVCDATIDMGMELQSLERGLAIKLAPQQREAVLQGLASGAMVITGGPGTGKTTIIQFILHIMQRLGLNFALCAPTGRAARRMAEATGFEGCTIHRLLEYGGEGRSAFTRNEENPLFFDMVVVDEMSMVDLPLFFALLRALPDGTRLVMVGDADQLPPVGAGTVLHDIIQSGLVNVVRLTEIYRQADRGNIAKNARRINEGKAPLMEAEGDFMFVPCSTQEQTAREVIRICASGSYAGDAYRDIQVLSPMKKGVLGVQAMNARIQHALNPPAPHKAEREHLDNIFREGDKVMQVKNNYRIEWLRTGANGDAELGAGVYNGDLGVITRIDPIEQSLDILFDDERQASYTFTQLDELGLAYCISIHKSQGSEFPLVVLPIFSGPPVLMTRNLLYTAVTRARTQVILLGSYNGVMQMVANRRMRKRYSALWAQMQALAAALTP